MSAERDDLDSLWFAATDRERVLRALAADAEEEGFRPVALEELAPYGRWLHGEEDPTVRRHAVAPPRNGWVGVFPSQPDWDQERTPALAERLGGHAACLMLHDGDVLTFQLYDGRRLLASHVSSPVHFDLPPRAEGELDFEPAALLPACRPGTTVVELVAALGPPGRIDVDGRRALRALAELLGIGPAAEWSYATLVAEDGLRLRREHGELRHVAFRLGEDDEAPTGAGRILRFPGGAGRPRA